MPTITPLTDATFDREIQGDTPVLVDFWAAWCGPCRMVAPVLEQIAAEYAGRLRIRKLNVDEQPVTPQKFGITGIPTLILFRNGKPIERIVGFLPKPRLVAKLQPYLQNEPAATRQRDPHAHTPAR